MSIETTSEPFDLLPELEIVQRMQLDEPDVWKDFQRKLQSRARRFSAKVVFGKSAAAGGVYRWGIAAATSQPCDRQTEILSRIACDRRIAKVIDESGELTDWADSLARWADATTAISLVEACRIVTWAATMPALAKTINPALWQRVLDRLLHVQSSAMKRQDDASPERLILAGELGLTLAWRLDDVTDLSETQEAACDAIAQWCQRDTEAISATIQSPVLARLVLASLIRSQRVMEATTKHRFTKRWRRVGESLANWIAALTDPTGRTAFSGADAKALSSDVDRHGLLQSASRFNPENIKPTMAAALGESPSSGRLEWQVDLPESMHHDPDAKTAVMFPDWDVRRGRVHLDYSGEQPQLEVFAGRPRVVSGEWQAMISVEGVEQQPCGQWADVCDFSDDDVHYVEIEQPWTGGLMLERQLLLIRDDRCLLMADSVLAGDKGDEAKLIRYDARLPIAKGIDVEVCAETRELFLRDTKRRAMVMPLSASEWLIGPTNATIATTSDNHLHLSSEGRGYLYVPLWLDFSRRRFNRKRTWRQLTVGDQLRLVGRDEAVGYRVQVGSEHWMIYRSLQGHVPRTILGKHIVADFFASRFDPGDGGHEELITVDDNERSDD